MVRTLNERKALKMTVSQREYTGNAHTHVAVIGSGFGGLGMAIQLQKAGIDDFVILERADDVGGVWRDNNYPGCACDVQSPLYSFSFAPNPDWHRMFSRQSEIHEYLQSCVDKFALRAHLRFGHDVLEMRWHTDTSRWSIDTSAGSFTADHVVVAAGALADPVIPDLPGLRSFRGAAFHSARWDHTIDLADKRVAVVGTGASAIQFVPAIQPQVGSVTVFQRTPPWVMPRHDRPFSEEERGRFRWLPALQRALRSSIYLQREATVFAFRRPLLMKLAEREAQKHLREQVSDPELRRRLTPTYRLGCKRILISNDYLRALDQPNADVVDSGIREVREGGIVDHEGVEHPADVIVFGTGFHASEMKITQRTYGRDGRTMSQTWAGSPRAYLGTTVAGFPNIYLIHGPNIGLGHTSVIHMMESQFRYILNAVTYSDENFGAAVEPTEDAQQRFVDQVDEATEGSVWTTGGCSSWYLDSTGRNSNLWPSSTVRYRAQTRRFVVADHTLTPAASLSRA
jgi:cation diffusion facilitator CzcD-associated flavoprotein CzcO